MRSESTSTASGSYSAPPSPRGSGVVEIELRLIDRAYAHLRIREPKVTARHVAALANDEHQAPVVVVARDGGRYALIEGDARVEALLRLGRDTVEAMVMALTEAEALSHCYRLQREGRRCALEEGWLALELLSHTGRLSQVASMLGRSVSWVSRRLGLARQLPEKVTDAVRSGRVPAHGAMKSLLPLARANKTHCERLCEQLGEARVSTRQLNALYMAWRAGDREQRERIVESPLLFLKAKDVVTPGPPEGLVGVLVREFGRAQALLLQARDAVARAWMADPPALSAAAVERAFAQCTEAYEALVRQVEEPDAE